jgi:hypothetical protein
MEDINPSEASRTKTKQTLPNQVLYKLYFISEYDN